MNDTKGDTKLTTVTTDNLDVFVNPHDMRKDLHTFIDYICRREVKRAHRDNSLPKSDLQRLAKLMTGPAAEAESWVFEVDELALKTGFVRYDTKGIYVGYSSSQPSYPDNYINFQEKPYLDFLSLSLAHQEEWLLKHLMNAKSKSNEFYTQGALSRLERFSSMGSATGVMQYLDFPKARWKLLDVLKQLDSGVWYSTDALIHYLKSHHRFFLIPERLPPGKNKWEKITRYGNFYESQYGGRSDSPEIADNATDGFERVEGRYVERFLEDLLLTFRFVDVAYGEPVVIKSYPSSLALRAFRINKSFLQVMRGEVPEPKVTVQPNFEIHVESAFYPINVLDELAPLTTLVASDAVTILKLDRKKATAHLAAEESTDIVKLLEELSGRALPQNVLMELEEWSGHSEVFTVYKGFGLLEGTAARPVPADFLVEEISPNLKIVRSPTPLFVRMEEAGQVPILVNHGENAFTRPPGAVTSIFAAKARAAAAKPTVKKPLLLKRETAITLKFPDEKTVEELRQLMVQGGCPIVVNVAKHELTYSQRHRTLAEAALKVLQSSYKITIEDAT